MFIMLFFLFMFNFYNFKLGFWVYNMDNSKN